MYRQSQVHNLHSSAATSADDNSASIYVGGYVEAVAYLDVTAETDSGSTLDIKFQTSPDGTSWYDIASGAIPQATGVGQSLFKIPATFGEYMRASYDVNEGSNVKATGTLTSDATNVTDNDTVTIGSTVYRFKNTLALAYDVKIGADAATTLDNLKAAVNASGTPGTEYFAGTLIHPTVSATTNTNTTQVFEAKTAGTDGNAIATTEASSHLSFGAATLTGGTLNGMTFDLKLALKS